MSIKIIIGPMFSGKTTALLDAIEKYKQISKRIIAINHSSDTRYGSNYLCTHDGLKVACLMRFELMGFLDTPCYNDADVIIIDEGQFYPDCREFCLIASERDGKDIVVAALNGDYMRQAFSSVSSLLPIATDIQFTKALCMVCKDGTPGIFSKRIVDIKSINYIGGSESYITVCRKHFCQSNQDARV